MMETEFSVFVLCLKFTETTIVNEDVFYVAMMSLFVSVSLASRLITFIRHNEQV